jgi:hypothetical protein
MSLRVESFLIEVLRSFFYTETRDCLAIRNEVIGVTLAESILIAIFCMAVVFAVLGILWALIRIFSWIIQKLEVRGKSRSVNS